MNETVQREKKIPREHILTEAVEAANEAFVTIDESSRVVIFNRAAERLFGRRRAQVLGRDFAEIIGGTDGERHRRALAEYLAGGRGRFMGHRNVVVIRRPDGTVVPASVSLSETTVDGRRYFTGILRDLTSERTMEERLANAERLALLGRMLAEISHEIKNPLVTIGGFARQVESQVEDEGLRRKLGLIVAETSRLEHLLAELRDIYSPPRLEVQPTDFAGLIDEVCEQLAEELAAHHITLRLTLDRRPLPVMADRRRLKQVVLNIMKNAMEAMPDGGTITVSARQAGDRIEMVVQDSGPGIPADTRDRIFDPFFTTKKRGSGLGLSISKRIIEEHRGGALLVESGEGCGTVVRIFLAANPDEP